MLLLLVESASDEDRDAHPTRAIAPPAKTPMERLKDLKALYEANLISDEQMEAKREAILATL